MKKLLLLLSVFVMVSCSTQKPKDITITYVTSPLNVPSIIEKENSIFAANLSDMGINVNYAEIVSGADQTQALASGDVHLLNAVGATSIILAAANGLDIKVLSMYSRSPKSFAIYSRDNSIITPEDMRGKKVAGPVGTNLHELLVAYLKSGGMTIDDVEFLNMGLPESKAALDSGNVDAALLAGPIAYAAAQSGYYMIADGDGLIDAIIAVSVTKKFYDENTEIIDAFLATQNQIADYINENEAEAIAIVAGSLDLPENVVSDMYALYNFSTDISEVDKIGFQKTSNFMYEAGMIEKLFDTSMLFIK